MANYGDKASNQRAQWWDDVVQPLSASSKLMGLGDYFTSRANWMKEPRPIRLAWQTEIKNMAKRLSDSFGEPFAAADMLTLAPAGDKADELHELALAESELDDDAMDAIEDADDALVDSFNDALADDAPVGGFSGFLTMSPWWSVGALIVITTGVTALVAKRRQRSAAPAGLAGRRQLRGGSSDGWYR